MRASNPLLCVALISLFYIVACDSKKQVTQFTSSVVDLSYQSKSEGSCETQDQKIIARSEKQAKNLLCERLVDHKANNYCATDLRQAEFVVNCPNLKWKMARETVATEDTLKEKITELKIPNLKKSTAFIIEAKNKLKAIKVIKSTISTGLSNQEAAIAENFIIKARHCGMSFLGPWCKEHKLRSVDYFQSVDPITQEMLLMVEALRLGQELKELYVFKLIPGEMIPTSMDLYSKLDPKKDQERVEEYLNRTGAVKKLATLDIQKQTVKQLEVAIESSTSLSQSFYLHLQYRDLRVLEAASGEVISKGILDLIISRISLFGTSRTYEYEEAMYEMAKDHGAKKVALLAIAAEMKKSNIEDIATMASANLLFISPTLVEEADMAVKAILHPAVRVRVKAIRGLSKIKLTHMQKLEVIQGMLDKDYDVRFASIEALSTIGLDHTLLPEILDNYKAQDRDVRSLIIPSVARVNAPESFDFLIEVATDESPSVFEAVEAALANIKILDSHLPVLAELSKSSDPKVRGLGLSSMTSNSSDVATLYLIFAMDDKDSELRSKVMTSLGSRKVRSNMSEALVTKYSVKKQSVLVRKKIIDMVDRLDAGNDIKLLVGLLQNSDQELSDYILGKLKAKKLTAEQQKSLTKLESKLKKVVVKDLQ